jgi:putative transferase (TIGR04331 family)
MKKAYDSKRRIKIFLKKIYGRFLSLCSPSHPILLFDMHFKQSDVWRLCLNTGFKAWPMTYEGKYESGVQDLPVDSTVRRDLVSLQNSFENDLFTQVLCQTLPVNLPICYLEGYSRIRSFAHKFFKGNACGIASSFGWTSNENFKFFAAESSENGSFLYSIQHGGASGVNKYTAGDVHMMKSSDVYFTWGWTDRNLKHAKPMPDPAIQHLRKNGNKLNSIQDNMPILFVGTIFQRYLHYFRYCPLGPQMVEYFSWQINFFKALPDNIIKSFIIRLYPKDFDWDNKKRLSDEVPGISFDDHSLSYKKQAKRCKLIITDNCQTTFLEALLLNRPTILFFDPMLWDVSDEAKPYMKLLQQAGILYYSPEEAANKLKNDHNRIGLWWYSEDVQQIRKEYIDYFAVSDNNWIRAWKNQIMSLRN